MVNTRLVACLAGLIVVGGALAQAQAPTPRLFRELIASVAADAVPPNPAPQTTVEFVVSWERPATAANPPGTSSASPLDRFVLTSTRPVTGRRSAQRRPELGPDQIVVVFRDAQGRERGWEAVTDPRLLRAELPSATGELRGQVFYRATAELVVAAPAGENVASLVVYQPAWNGTDFLLTPIGVIVVAR